MDKITRCKWCVNNPLYIEYHDKEWGFPIYNDKKIFEFLKIIFEVNITL